MKKILILTSSPNADGSSNSMAASFEAAARGSGASVRRVDMTTTRGSGCTACMSCRRALDKCSLHDQVGELLDELHAIDVLVMAAPVWWMDLPVAMRRFVERWYSLVDVDFNPRLPPNKTGVLLLSQGEGEMCFLELAERYKEMLEWLGFKEVHLLRHCSADENHIRTSGVLDSVAKLARKLSS